MGRGVVVKRSKLLEQLRELGATQKHVAVGVIGAKASEAHDDPGAKQRTTVGQVAVWNHYGTERIPARPFLTLALEQHKEELRKLQLRLGVALVTGKIVLDQALALLGEAAVAKIKQTIADGVPPPNAPSTVAQKGSSKPLIDTGQLRGSITYAVRESE